MKIISWLGLYNLFQTYPELDEIKDKQSEIVAIRQVLDSDDVAEKETSSC